MKTALILKTGSSSLEATLVYPLKCSKSTSHPALRIATAHAERLNSSDACLRICIFMTAFHLMCDDSCEGEFSTIDEEEKQLRLVNSPGLRSRSHCVPPTGKDWIKRQTLRKLKYTGKMSYEEAINQVIGVLKRFSPELDDSIAVVGHHIMHGTDESSVGPPSSLSGDVPGVMISTIVDDEVLNTIQRASLSSSRNIAIAMKTFQKVPNVAIFDSKSQNEMDYGNTDHHYEDGIPSDDEPGICNECLRIVGH